MLATLRVVAFAAGVFTQAPSQGGASPQRDTAQAQAPAGVPVVFGGDTLFRLFAPLGPFSPEDRARAIVQRLRRLSRSASRSADSVLVADSAGVSSLSIGDTAIMTVTNRDAAMAGVGRTALADSYAAALTRALREEAGAWTLQSLLLGLLWTLLATAALAALLWVLARLFPIVYSWLAKLRTGTRLSLRIQSLELISPRRVADTLLTVAKAIRVALVVLAFYFYLPLVFSFFPWTRGYAPTILNWILDPLGQAWRGFVGYLPDLFSVAVIVVVIRYLLKFIHLFFVGIERGAISLPGFFPDWGEPTYKIVRFLVIVFGAIAIYPYLPGSDTAAFKGVSLFLGALVSFGSAGAIANVVAGVVMTYMRPFQLGDRVKIADTVGDIVQKTLLVTRVRTIKNVDVTIPNAMVLASHIINYSSSAAERGLILHTTVTIGYDTPWARVYELLLSAADATEGVLKNPKPFVLQTSLTDFYVAYELNAYTEQPNAMARIYSDLHENIQNAFNEGGVEIMSPHYTALRDGNQTTIAEDHLPKSYQAPGFRIWPVAKPAGSDG